jgi:hypothetical protein
MIRVLFSGCTVKLTLVGIFQEGSTLTGFERNSAARKENPGYDAAITLELFVACGGGPGGGEFGSVASLEKSLVWPHIIGIL